MFSIKGFSNLFSSVVPSYSVLPKQSNHTRLFEISCADIYLQLSVD